MTGFGRMTGTAAAALLATALGACSGTGGNNQASGNAAAGGEPAVSTAGPALGPLTARDICARLEAGTVRDILDKDEVTAEPSSSGTPQCSYSYAEGGATTSFSVAYMRPAEELAGNEGAAGYDYVARVNRSMAAGVQEQPVQAGQRAMRLSGPNLQFGLVLTGGRVITVAAPANLPAAAVDRLIQAAGEAFGH